MTTNNINYFRLMTIRQDFYWGRIKSLTLYLLLASFFFLTDPSTFQAGFALADGGGGGGDTAAEYEKYFQERNARKDKAKRSTRKQTSRSSNKKAGSSSREPIQKPRKKVASTAPIVKPRQESAESLKKRLDEAHAYWTNNGRTIHQQVDDQRDLIHNLSLALDAVDTLTDELILILDEQLALDKVIQNWSANPYGEGRWETKAKTKTAIATTGLIFTGKVNPVTVILGLMADGMEGVGRLWYKQAARTAILKDVTSVSQALKNGMAQYKKLKIALEAAQDDLNRLLVASNSVFELSIDHQAAVEREKKEARPAVRSAQLTRDLDLEGSLEELRKLKSEQRRKFMEHGVTKCP